MTDILDIVALTNEPPQMVRKAFRGSTLEGNRRQATALGVVFARSRWWYSSFTV